MKCKNCGSTEDIKTIQSKGYMSCCPEREIVSTVKELTDEVYFCSRCGKRLSDGIHTCTPPADILRKAQEK